MTQVVILAAGQGKRMLSNFPKVMHELAGKPIIEHVLTTVYRLQVRKPIVVYGHQGHIIQSAFSHCNIEWVEQTKQLGTGHALLQCIDKLQDDQKVLVLCGDVPLINASTLQSLIKTTPSNAIGMLTAIVDHPYGYGRIIRENGAVVRIVEEKDATEDQRLIKEINPGIYLFPATFLKQNLPKLTDQNAQKEYYLTDLIIQACRADLPIHTESANDVHEILGVNDRAQLAVLERYYQQKLARTLMLQGVTILDPARVDIRGELECGCDVIIDVNTVFEGRVVIGQGSMIGANTVIRNSMIGAHVEIKPFSIVDGAEVAEQCVIGPFARIRPGTVLAKAVHIGNFVEIKNSWIGESSKTNHLSYIGDSEIGRAVNIGAGTITCNYDGANKHKTIVGDYTHIGSDTQLVAPVKIGEGATIAAGSTITKDVPPNQLTLTHRLEQRTLHGWQRPQKHET